MDETIRKERQTTGMTGFVEFAQETMPVSSMRDLALGYWIGTLKMGALAFVVLRHPSEAREEDEETVITMITRRLPEIIERIERELGR